MNIRKVALALGVAVICAAGLAVAVTTIPTIPAGAILQGTSTTVPNQPVSILNPDGTQGTLGSGFDSGPITASATPNSSSHAAGSSIGGLLPVPIARINGGSGILTGVNWMSAGGSTGTLVVRIWAKNPVNTTCTDQTAYAGSAVDDAFLVTPPFSITPSAPAVTTGDAKTYAAQTGLSLDYKNLDTSAGQNLYVCAVTVSTDTADESAKVTVTLSGPQN